MKNQAIPPFFFVISLFIFFSNPPPLIHQIRDTSPPPFFNVNVPQKPPPLYADLSICDYSPLNRRVLCPLLVFFPHQHMTRFFIRLFFDPLSHNSTTLIFMLLVTDSIFFFPFPSEMPLDREVSTNRVLFFFWPPNLVSLRRKSRYICPFYPYNNYGSLCELWCMCLLPHFCQDIFFAVLYPTVPLFMTTASPQVLRNAR